MTAREILEQVAGSPATIAVVAVACGFVAGRVIVAIARPLLARAARQTESQWDDELVAALTTPVSTLLALQGARIAMPWLPIDERAATVTISALGVCTTVVVLWIVFRSIDVTRAALERRSWATERPAARSLLRIGGRFAKVIVLLITLVIALAHLGVSVASLVAGLGIGGLALALAAQKTVENLFGTLSIGIDQPLHEGDFVKIGDVLGTVEAIGLRSTRIRTLDRTLVTIPNGQLADSRIESYTVRDRIRLFCTIGLVYQTSSSQLRGALAGFEAVLRGHPKIWPDTVVVRFVRFGESSLDVEVMAWFLTSDWQEFQAIRQEVLIALIEVVERTGTGFAYPTRTVHVAGDRPAALGG
jgi:MscS family membrane protein